jgi:hypothetical protein
LIVAEAAPRLGPRAGREIVAEATLGMAPRGAKAPRYSLRPVNRAKAVLGNGLFESIRVARLWCCAR